MEALGRVLAVAVFILLAYLGARRRKRLTPEQRALDDIARELRTANRRRNF